MDVTSATNQKSWPLRVRDWVGAIIARGRYSTSAELRAIAEQYQFPKSARITFANWLSKELAGWIIKQTIRSSAKELGYSLSDTEVELLTDVALGLI